MGVNGVLPKILPSAGRENYDLRALADGLVEYHRTQTVDSSDDSDEPSAKRRRLWTRRKVRVAVDVNGWIARAAHGYGGDLMDERHSTYHGRAELRNEQQMQQQPNQSNNEREGEQASHLPTTTAAGTNNNNNHTDQTQKQRIEYITKVISFVLQRIEYLRDECSTMVIPVLDGATPPCKLTMVKQRSNKRKRASEQRDEVAQSPARASMNDDAANTIGNGQDEEDAEEEDEATRTHAEVLSRISKSKQAGTGKDYALRIEILSELLQEFRKRRWPFIVAPYEADGQLSYLANTRGVDLVVTEDSDLIALGCPTLVYKMGGWNGLNAANRGDGGASNNNVFGRRGQQRNSTPGYHLRGTMLHRHDLGSSHGINLLDFTDAMLATMFVAAGCDYSNSLKGIGIVTARNIVKKAFHGGEADESHPSLSSEPVLKVVLNQLFKQCQKEAHEQVWPLDDPEKDEARDAYERSFLAALAMYRHPLVYDPIARVHVIANDVSDGSTSSSRVCSETFLRDERILMEYEPYRELVTRKELLYQVIGTPFAPKVARGISEGLIDPRQLPAPDLVADNTAESNHEIDDNAAAQESSQNQTEDEEETESRDLTQEGSAMQLSSQEFSGMGTQQSGGTQLSSTQQSKSSSMISSLSPDLLASPSQQSQTF